MVAEPLLARFEGPLSIRLRTARDLLAPAAERVETPEVEGAALPALARLLPRGLPRGELTELAGRRSSGRFALVLATLAAATAAGECAALVDLGDALDPRGAARAGVELARLLWVRPRRFREAVAATEALVGGGFPIVVLDLGLFAPGFGTCADAVWLRLVHAAREHRATLLLSSPRRTAPAAAVATVLELSPERRLWRGESRAPRLLAGIAARLALARERHHGSPFAPPASALGLSAPWSGSASFLTLSSSSP